MRPYAHSAPAQKKAESAGKTERQGRRNRRHTGRSRTAKYNWRQRFQKSGYFFGASSSTSFSSHVGDLRHLRGARHSASGQVPACHVNRRHHHPYRHHRPAAISPAPSPTSTSSLPDDALIVTTDAAMPVNVVSVKVPVPNMALTLSTHESGVKAGHGGRSRRFRLRHLRQRSHPPRRLPLRSQQRKTAPMPDMAPDTMHDLLGKFIAAGWTNRSSSPTTKAPAPQHAYIFIPTLDGRRRPESLRRRERRQAAPLLHSL